MHPLAGRTVTKMNGLGNVILILDLRDTAYRLDPPMVRAIAQAPDLLFDQLMFCTRRFPPAPRPMSASTIAMAAKPAPAATARAASPGSCLTMTGHRTASRSKHSTAFWNAGAWASGAFRSKWVRRSSIGATFRWQSPLPTHRLFLSRSARTARHASPPLSAWAIPHAVFFFEDFPVYDLSILGPELERDALFPERANISFAPGSRPRPYRRPSLGARRRASPRACGSAACAVLVAAARKGLTGRHAVVSLPGGDLSVTWRESDDQVVLTGPDRMGIRSGPGIELA